MLTLLSRVFRTPRRLSTSRLKFTVYTRAQCCCCHKALELLEEFQKRYGFRIEVVDIDADPELRKVYDTEVPVVAIEGKVRFRGVVNRALLARLLTAELRNTDVSASDGGKP
jgi:glutaredoxin